ncbi:MAG: PAS domain S-box protein [Anaerolineae bacterium]
MMEVRFWLLTLTPLLALLSYAVLLALVFARARRYRLYRFFALYLFSMAIWSLGSAMMRLDPSHILFWNKVLTGGAVIMPWAFYGFVQAFLGEEKDFLLWAGLAAVGGLEIAVALGLMASSARLLQGGLLQVDTGPGIIFEAAYWTIFVGFAAWRLIRALRRTKDPVLRNRIRYPLLGVVFVMLGSATNTVPALGVWPIDHAANLINAVLLTYAVLRYQLVDIALVVRKGLLYSIPTATIGIGYFLIISLAILLFSAFSGPELFLLSILVAAIVAVIAQPLRDRAQLWIDKLFFREKYDSSLMLQRLSRTAASVLDLDKLTGMILDEVTSTVHIERSVFFLKQEESGEYHLIAQRGLSPDADLRFRADHPVADWLSAHEHALTRYEMDVIPQFKALWSEEREDLTRLAAELFIPLKAKGELVGILAVGPKLSQEAYSLDDQLTLITLANQTATALENARLHEETRRRNRELALLNRVIAMSAASHDAASILRAVCRELALAFGEFRSFAMFFSGESAEAFVTECDLAGALSSATADGARAVDPLSLQDKLVPATHSRLLRRLQVDKTPLLLDDSRADPVLASFRDLMGCPDIASVMAVPLLVDDDVAGCLGLHATKPHGFSPGELDLVRRVADQVSSALVRNRLAETQQRLSTAIEQIAEAVMIVDTDGHILYVNPAFEQVSGYGREEAIGRNPRILKSGKQDAVVYEQLWRTISAGKVWEGRLINRRKDGALYTGDIIITPVRDQSGEIVNYVATQHDISREIQLEQQFHQSQKMEALGRLAGGIAHDFNNLLTIIHLSTRLLERQVKSNTTLLPHVQRIEETGERAAKLTKQLLSFSRREIIEPQIVNLNDLVSELSGMLQRVIGEDIELVTMLGEDIWSLKADASQIEQVIVNLAVNARDAMPNGGTLTIETANVILDHTYVARHVDARSGEHVMLAISDTGIGMDDEVKSHLFEPFFTTKEREQGTGLGLSTVFGIVRRGEGHIRVQSEVGEGARFEIYLPSTQERPAETVSQGPSLSAAEGTGTILLVEDEDGVRELTARTLIMQGYQVLVAGNGQEALQVSKGYAGPINLLLTDVVMPLMDGRSLVKQLQPQRPDMRVLYMSGYADRPLVKQFMSDPNIAFLAKPFTMEGLTQKVRVILENNG